MKKLTEAGTCPECGGNRIRQTRGQKVGKVRVGGKRFLECVECGTQMKPRKRGRTFVGIGL